MQLSRRAFLDMAAALALVGCGSNASSSDDGVPPGPAGAGAPSGGGFDASHDATIRAFKQSGLYDAIAAGVGEANVGGKDRPVHVTSFREDGWTAVETESLTTHGTPRLSSDWIRDQLRGG